MEVIRTKLGNGGRVIIPSLFRQNLHLMAGDDIILHMKDDTIYITTSNQALSKLQTKVKNHINVTSQNISLVDELIAMRRLEADCE
ncbi:AbrB/MazE/SpoVT family DNA-binding domain-containing protein [Candidatus Tisiphia endosymbiont of Hybos culiciformis]|uniref:AbrB/MazE/SpoVT family DNA-binding domain-containing protein n=1 Tax=Candidatus Tisiphia endosymbiont of Hybos culiciformis TaxID=3139331 RepID=UPI003CCB22D5